MGQKNLQLQADLEPSPEPLLADPTRMGQVFQNLLSNAIKFTPEEGEIAVRLVYSDAQVEVQISDTGIGVNPDLLPHIFNQFRQADSSNTRQQGGLGLGLFLVRSIVAAHGGTIQADSAGPDQGTTFTITLPRIPTEATAAEIAPSAPLAMGNSRLEGRRLLLVDDDAMNLELYTFALENFGATVLVASSAADALSVLENESVDIIISDIGLPLMNGYEFMRTVRSQPAAGGQTPAIALSGYASQNDIQAALDAGFQIHLAKPVDLDELVGAVCSLIAA
jgi:CheY-like chemotaxis protein